MPVPALTVLSDWSRVPKPTRVFINRKEVAGRELQEAVVLPTSAISWVNTQTLRLAQQTEPTLNVPNPTLLIATNKSKRKQKIKPCIGEMNYLGWDLGGLYGATATIAKHSNMARLLIKWDMRVVSVQSPSADVPPDLLVHGSWIFTPWNRYYMYLWEKKLGSLVGDPTLAIPFWNWDAGDGMHMPKMYLADTASPLYDDRRDHERFSICCNELF
ncbi:hypothetical protein IFM89_019257 [Coptis chinensis]|uniref:Tyrosinase copper-binding domain-containing protein n=1 Tax=Coptis chinensis TaxID=261450 RepID=A0A835H7E6_9MAGN|nr:hypothetical protein IFM89_019257 [Coptis chinensis]